LTDKFLLKEQDVNRDIMIDFEEVLGETVQ
jgi:hypothetical protein